MKAVVLSLLCLTTFATSASAEAAWILWRHEEQGPNVGWTIESATETAAGCNELQRAGWAVNSLKFMYPPEEGYFVGITGSDGYIVVHRDDWGKFPSQRRHFSIAVVFKCLPDTVDPRGPKGGQ